MESDKKTIVHFGAGALGRGFIVPILVESGCKVYLADTDPEIITLLKDTKAYHLLVTDEEKDKKNQLINIEGILSPTEDKEKFADLLKVTDTVTTSVRKENLVHVARTLAGVWGTQDCRGRMVLCCENVEHVSGYFKTLLYESAEDEYQRQNLSMIKVPDVMVDRGCTADPEDLATVVVKKFYEIAVDKNEVNDTGIRLIPAVDNIEGCFYRKRFLLNTYADALAFIAMDKGIDTLYDAVRDQELTGRMKPYMEAVKFSLVHGWSMKVSEVEQWETYYRQRNLNSAGNKRSLDSIARDMWRKLEYEERFIKPLAIAQKYGYDIDKAAEFIANIVSIEIKRNPMDKMRALDRLKQMWECRDAGKEIFRLVKKYMK